MDRFRLDQTTSSAENSTSAPVLSIEYLLAVYNKLMETAPPRYRIHREEGLIIWIATGQTIYTSPEYAAELIRVIKAASVDKAFDGTSLIRSAIPFNGFHLVQIHQRELERLARKMMVAGPDDLFGR